MRSTTVLLTAALTAAAGAGARSVETQGGLVADHPLDCVAATTVTSDHTAVDVVVGAHACAILDRFDDAAELMLIATAYTYFDTRRVLDTSAHAALNAMLTEATAGLPAGAMDTLMAAMDQLDGDIGRKVRVCDHLEASAPPAYAPTYMVERGREASVERGGAALAPGFDAAAAWGEARSFVKCGD